MSTINELPATIPVTIHIDAGALLGAYQDTEYFSDKDGDEGTLFPREELGDRLRNQIIEQAANNLARKTFDDTFADVVREQVEQRVNDLITEALDQSVAETDAWGNRKNPLTIREQIAKTVTEWHGGVRDKYQSQTNFQKYIKDVVDRAIVADLDGAVKEQRAALVAHFRTAAAQLIAEQVAKP